MSLKRFQANLADNKELGTELLNAKTVLERNIRSVKTELIVLNEASVKLSKETGEIRERIANNSKDLKERIDKYVCTINESLEANFQTNITEIGSHRNLLEDKVKQWDIHVDKCKNALSMTSSDKENLVSERKVLQMILDSVDTGFAKPDLKLTRTAFIAKDSAFKDEKLEELVGTLDKKDEYLDDIHHDLFEIKSFECPKLEINAIACDPDDRSVWTCMGTRLDIVNFADDGEVNRTVAVDLKTDDIALGSDGNILTTSPDGQSVLKVDCTQASDIRLRVNKSDTTHSHEDEQVNITSNARELYTNCVYIHGICRSMDGTKVIACATDKPNYSDIKPNETAILEIHQDGSLIRKVKVLQFKGKVYRISENVNGEYVLTFPKEGCVLSVGRKGVIISAYSKQTGSPNKTIDRGRVFNLKEFWPTGVCCNTKGRIFVTDWLGKRVVVLDSLCKFVRCIGSDFVNPNAICVNLNLDTIWIGDKGRIHVWQT